MTKIPLRFPGAHEAIQVSTDHIGRDEIMRSNIEILERGFRSQIVSEDEFRRIPSDALTIFSDFVVRVHVEDAGILKETPLYVQFHLPTGVSGSD